MISINCIQHIYRVYKNVLNNLSFLSISPQVFFFLGQYTEEQNKYQVLFFVIAAAAEITLKNEVLQKANQTSIMYMEIYVYGNLCRNDNCINENVILKYHIVVHCLVFLSLMTGQTTSAAG